MIIQYVVGMVTDNMHSAHASRCEMLALILLLVAHCVSRVYTPLKKISSRKCYNYCASFDWSAGSNDDPYHITRHLYSILPLHTINQPESIKLIPPACMPLYSMIEHDAPPSSGIQQSV